MSLRLIGRTIWPLLSAGILLSVAPVHAAPLHFEKHFPVKGRPVVVLQNIANGRIEVKSWRNPEVVITGTQGSSKINIESEQVGDRVRFGAGQHRHPMAACAVRRFNGHGIRHYWVKICSGCLDS